MADIFKGPLWLVWSNEHRAWWGPNNCGYTLDISKAGRYTFARAVMICDQRQSGNVAPDEVVVPSPELIAQIEANTLFADDVSLELDLSEVE